MTKTKKTNTKAKPRKTKVKINTEQKEAERLVAKWQRLLYLQDWTISVHVVTAKQMQDFTSSEEPSLGCAQSLHERKICSIRILRKEDAIKCYHETEHGDAKFLDSLCLENTVCHEMIHAVLSPLTMFKIRKGDEEHFRSAMEVVDNHFAKIVKRLDSGTFIKAQGVFC